MQVQECQDQSFSVRIRHITAEIETYLLAGNYHAAVLNVYYLKSELTETKAEKQLTARMDLLQNAMNMFNFTTALAICQEIYRYFHTRAQLPTPPCRSQDMAPAPHADHLS